VTEYPAALSGSPSWEKKALPSRQRKSFQDPHTIGQFFTIKDKDAGAVEIHRIHPDHGLFRASFRAKGEILEYGRS
jgi:hypothetical protein